MSTVRTHMVRVPEKWTPLTSDSRHCQPYRHEGGTLAP